MSYVAIFNHSPAECPGAHKEMFDLVGGQMSRLEEVSSEMGISEIQIHVLLPGHKGVLVMQAPDYTTARRFVMELGIDNWNDVTLYESVAPQEAMAISAERFGVAP